MQNTRHIARELVLVSLTLSTVAAFALSVVLPDWVAVLLAFGLTGPAVHRVAGKLMNRRPERWGDGDAIIATGFVYPVLLWLFGTLFVAAMRSLPMAALFFFAPVVVVVVLALVFDPNRGPLRAAERERQAIADERGWELVANGTKALGDHWATDGKAAHLTARAVLAGDIDGWPVTICDVVARHRLSENRTVTCVVHLPVSLPRTVALPFANSILFGGAIRGRPWTAVEHAGQATTGDMYLASSEPAFAERLATPEVRRATVDGDLMFWRIEGRDLAIAAQAQGRRIPGEATLRTASKLVALARALPADVIDDYATPPLQGLPFREPSPHDGSPAT